MAIDHSWGVTMGNILQPSQLWLCSVQAPIGNFEIGGLDTVKASVFGLPIG